MGVNKSVVGRAQDRRDEGRAYQPVILIMKQIKKYRPKRYINIRLCTEITTAHTLQENLNRHVKKAHTGKPIGSVYLY